MQDTRNNEYAGMTLNERLSVAGLMKDFDQAAKTRDREVMIRILRQVALDESQAGWSADTILANPKKYGY